VKSLVNFEARDLEQWSRQVNGTTFLCLASVHRQKSNLNLKCTSGECSPVWSPKCYHSVISQAEGEIDRGNCFNRLESWI
jgi:hypothetical protein